MTHWFGLKPPEGTEYSSLIGARAIYDKRGKPYMADFLGDRFSYEGRVAEDGDKDLILWVNRFAIPTIKNWVQSLEPLNGDRWRFGGTPYSACAEAKSDYIYCAFWRSNAWTFRESGEVRRCIKELIPTAVFRVRSQTVIPEGGTLDDVQQIFIIDCKPGDRETIGSIISGSNAWLKKESEVPF